MEAEDDPQELPQVAVAPPFFPHRNLYMQLMQDITKDPPPPVREESHDSSPTMQE
jgi:hypothetical protein